MYLEYAWPDIFGAPLYLVGDVGRPCGLACPNDSVQDIQVPDLQI
jgi:hypothetical protein